MEEYTSFCALCGGPIEDPDVQVAQTQMGMHRDSYWLSEAVLLHAEAGELPDSTLLEVPAKNRGGPIFELVDSADVVTACDVSGAIVPSPRPLYIPCHAACMTIAEKVMMLNAQQIPQPLSPHKSSAIGRNVDESKQHLWRVLKARFEKASDGKFHPVTNIGLIHDYGGIWRFQSLAWEPGSEGLVQVESEVSFT